MDNLAEYSAISIALFVIYALIDKVVVPQIKSRSANNGQQQNKGQWDNERRIANLESDTREVRKQLSQITADAADLKGLVKVSQAILERVESDLKER